MKAVQFDHYGGVDVLEAREVPAPSAPPGGLVVAVKAAAVNPGEIWIREGAFAERWPTSFPCGEGSDLAGLVVELGPGTTSFSVGDAVCGWTDARASHAERVAVPAVQVTSKPEGVPWEVAGSLYVAPLAAYASVAAVSPSAGEIVVVSAAAGGVGCVAVQLARRAGATVIGLASERHHGWLRAHGVLPVPYGDGQAERILRAAGRVPDAFVDTFGDGYPELAVELGVPRNRINTIADDMPVERLGIRAEGTQSVARIEVVRELAELVAGGELEIPIARTFPLVAVRDAYRELAKRRTRGKIVLVP